jgi:exodeoxyribonuclease VII large subunit
MAQSGDRLAELVARARAASLRAVLDHAKHVASAGQLLESFSYERVLDRGFVLVHDAAGHSITSAEEARAAGAVDLRFRDGEVAAQVDGPSVQPRPRKTAKTAKPAKEQGRLL